MTESRGDNIGLSEETGKRIAVALEGLTKLLLLIANPPHLVAPDGTITPLPVYWEPCPGCPPGTVCTNAACPKMIKWQGAANA